VPATQSSVKAAIHSCQWHCALTTDFSPPEGLHACTRADCVFRTQCSSRASHEKHTQKQPLMHRCLQLHRLLSVLARLRPSPVRRLTSYHASGLVPSSRPPAKSCLGRLLSGIGAPRFMHCRYCVLHPSSVPVACSLAPVRVTRNHTSSSASPLLLFRFNNRRGYCCTSLQCRSIIMSSSTSSPSSHAVSIASPPAPCFWFSINSFVRVRR
jgi:hypothetical protein